MTSGSLGGGRITYLNGVYMPLEQARVPIFDRGFNLGDGVYEVTAFVNRCMVDFEAHLSRLRSSLAQVGILVDLDDADWQAIHHRLIFENPVDTGTVYIQVTRGVMERDFVPSEGQPPTILGLVQAKALDTDPRLATGISAALVEDLRWKRRDIKSTSLLAQVLAKSRAHEMGAGEAILHEGGVVTEGGSTTVFGVDNQGVLWTHPLGPIILPGITRRRVIALSKDLGLQVREEPITLSALHHMSEVFLTGATFFVVPVVQIDSQKVAEGRPGSVALTLQNAYLNFVRHGGEAAKPS
ncbi:aminotransferase class IV (plasmid) [Mesorhizobium sp. AR07]|nr:aminotransferase class IV [Mesorhizobium sp. AR07]